MKIQFLTCLITVLQFLKWTLTKGKLGYGGYRIRFDIDDKASNKVLTVYMGYVLEEPQTVQKTLYGSVYGVADGNLIMLKWDDIDFEAKTIRVTPEKGREPRIFRVSLRLLGMLNQLPKTSEGVFAHYKSLKDLRKNFERQRKKIAHKLGNPRLLKTSFHIIRHWKGTVEYAKTRDILHVMRLLGHKEY